jgi:hypothetical protein
VNDLERSSSGRERAYIELLDALDGSDLLGGELEGESLDVLVKVLDLPSADDGEDVRGLGEDVWRQKESEDSMVSLRGRALSEC